FEIPSKCIRWGWKLIITACSIKAFLVAELHSAMENRKTASVYTAVSATGPFTSHRPAPHTISFMHDPYGLCHTVPIRDQPLEQYRVRWCPANASRRSIAAGPRYDCCRACRARVYPAKGWQY